MLLEISITIFSGCINNVQIHPESFSTCKKLHLETIGMANLSKWKYWSDRGFPNTRQQCEMVVSY